MHTFYVANTSHGEWKQSFDITINSIFHAFKIGYEKVRLVFEIQFETIIVFNVLFKRF